MGSEMCIRDRDYSPKTIDFFIFIGTKINLLAASDNLLMAIDLADGITFHSTPQWPFPHLLSGMVLPDVRSCRLRDIFLHLPQMHLQSLQ